MDKQDISINMSCAWCGHDESKHHPTRTETWCIAGIAESRHCGCPGYNPNSKELVDKFIKAIAREALQSAAISVPVSLWSTFGGAPKRVVEGFKSWLMDRAERIQ